MTAVEAFTWGWDVSAPARTVMWQLRGSHGWVRHWDDHSGPAAGRTRYDHELTSRRARTLLLHPAPGRYGASPHRTVVHFEVCTSLRLAGIWFVRNAPCVP